MSDHNRRKHPNIVMTGTPGTGKTTHAQLLASQSPVPLQHIDVGELVKNKSLHDGYDEEWQSYTVDEDKLLDELEPLASSGGLIFDWHTCGIYPERWIDLVVVLQCNHTKLWDRLEQRNYSTRKIQENNQCEIMQSVLEEAMESYASDIILVLSSETTDDLDSNIDRIVTWINTWRNDQGLSNVS